MPLIALLPQLQFMKSKLLNKEITNIIGAYLYNHTPPSPHAPTPTTPATAPPHAGYRNIIRPLDGFLRSYFNNHKYLGGSQRSTISDKVYSLVRYEYLLSHLIRSKPFELDVEYRFGEQLQREVEYKLNMLFSSEFYNAIDNQNLPKFLRASQNKLLFTELSYSLAKPGLLPERRAIVDRNHTYELGDEDAAYHVSHSMNTRAPLTLRVNPLKITKHELVERLEKKLKLRLQKCEYAPLAFKIVAPKNINLLDTEEFERGCFEIQDEGSQLAALRADIRPGQLVLDYCGGSGGKSLAIAHLLQNTGQIFVHEPREVALGKARKRFSRAGVNNVQFHSGEESLGRIGTGKMDWVIVDAPCTGTGTLRRNPDIKLKFTEAWLKSNVLLQQQIVAKAMKYLSRSGRMLYITCSLLRQENEEQVKLFCRLHNLEVENGELMKILPQKDGADGFFAAVLRRRH